MGVSWTRKEMIWYFSTVSYANQGLNIERFIRIFIKKGYLFAINKEGIPLQEGAHAIPRNVSYLRTKARKIFKNFMWVFLDFPILYST